LKQKNKISLNNNIKKLLSLIGRKRVVEIVMLQLLSIISSLIDAVSVGAIVPFIAILSSPENFSKNSKVKHILNSFKIYENNQLVIYLTSIFIILVLLSGILRWLLIYYNSKVSNSIGSDLAYLLYKNTLYQPYLNHTARNSSEIIAGVSRAGDVVSLIVTPIFLLMNSLFTVIFLIITLIILNPVIIFLTFFIIGVLYLTIMHFVKDKLKSESAFISSKKPLLLKALQEGLGGIRDILIDGSQEVYSDIFYKNERELRNSNARVTLITNTPNIAIQTFGITIIAIFAGVFSVSNNLSNDSFSNGLPFLGALAFAYLRISPAIQQIYTTWANIKNGEPSLIFVINFLQNPLPSYAGMPLPDPIPFNKSIKINNLSFYYNKDTDNVLKNISLEITKGSKVGFVGETGSGKSTLLDIIMSLIDPTNGFIEIDGVKIDNNNFRSWQIHIAHVPQSIYLADSTVAENIAFGVPLDKIDFNLVKTASEKAQIVNTINSLENGYHTIIGERGIRLSGGQRQRLGIARALYKNADVIVLDEATSALDNDTESNVMNAINNLGSELTILIVAHRITTLKSCDKIVELKNGEIIVHNNYDLFNNSLIK
jgi:ABC-type multidrug transport system fused ATPase/permease subunit